MRYIPRRRHIAVTTRITAAAAAASGTAYLALTSAKLVVPHPAWQIAAICTDAGVALAGSARAAYKEVQRPTNIATRASARARLEAAWFGCADSAGIDVRELLVSLFLVTGAGRWAHLERYMRVGIKQIGESNVRWTKGKGVIGKCWATGATQRKDLTRLTRTYGDCSREQWVAKRIEEKVGLPYEDWVKTRKKYNMIIAVPIHRDNRFIGCVALTGPTHNTTWLGDQKVEEALVAAARAIAITSHL